MEFTFADRAVFFEGTLILADLHLGREAAASVQVPVGSDHDAVERLDALCARFDPEQVVIAGDVLHAFDSVSAGVAETLSEIRERAETADARVVVTRGNHDARLDSVWDGPTTDAYRVGDAVVCHGHERPESDADVAIVGHDHPALVVEGQKRPCYLRGPGVGFDDVLVLPAFDRLAAGTAVNDATGDAFHTPLLDHAGSVRPIVLDEDTGETLSFPRLSSFRDLL
jgi:putative SbcD/Mre11-related phosphoesterase